MAKTLTYRIVIFALLAGITYYFTGNAGQTTIISIVFNVCGALVYYVYERLWNVIEWGRDGELRGSRSQTHLGSNAGLTQQEEEIPKP